MNALETPISHRDLLNTYINANKSISNLNFTVHVCKYITIIGVIATLSSPILFIPAATFGLATCTLSFGVVSFFAVKKQMEDYVHFHAIFAYAVKPDIKDMNPQNGYNIKTSVGDFKISKGMMDAEQIFSYKNLFSEFKIEKV